MPQRDQIVEQALTLTPEDRAYVADSLVFAAVTSIVWWFGDRAPKKSSH